MPRCKECSQYDIEKERYDNIEGWKLAPCKKHGVEVPGKEPTCDDYDGEIPEPQGKRYSTLPRGMKIAEAIAIKEEIMRHPGLSSKELMQFVPLKEKRISAIRSGRSWDNIPCIYKTQTGGKFDRRMELK